MACFEYFPCVNEKSKLFRTFSKSNIVIVFGPDTHSKMMPLLNNGLLFKMSLSCFHSEAPPFSNFSDRKINFSEVYKNRVKYLQHWCMLKEFTFVHNINFLLVFIMFLFIQHHIWSKLQIYSEEQWKIHRKVGNFTLSL